MKRLGTVLLWLMGTAAIAILMIAGCASRTPDPEPSEARDSQSEVRVNWLVCAAGLAEMHARQCVPYCDYSHYTSMTDDVTDTCGNGDRHRRELLPKLWMNALSRKE